MVTIMCSHGYHNVVIMVTITLSPRLPNSCVHEAHNYVIHASIPPLSDKGHEACALLLLDRNGSTTVNKQNKENKTPLHIAARTGLHPVVQELIRQGADCSLVDNEGQCVCVCVCVCLCVCACVIVTKQSMEPILPLPPPPTQVTRLPSAVPLTPMWPSVSSAYYRQC